MGWWVKMYVEMQELRLERGQNTVGMVFVFLLFLGKKGLGLHRKINPTGHKETMKRTVYTIMTDRG